MKAHRLVEKLPSSNICLFCQHRAQSTQGRAPLHSKRRTFTQSRPSYAPPAEAVARQEPEDDSFPDSELGPRPKRRAPLDNPGTSSQNEQSLNRPYANQSQLGNFQSNFRISRHGAAWAKQDAHNSSRQSYGMPRLDGATSGNGGGRSAFPASDTASSYEQNRGRTPERPLIRFARGDTTEKPRYSRAGFQEDRTEAHEPVAPTSPRTGWGRHLPLRNAQTESTRSPVVNDGTGVDEQFRSTSTSTSSRRDGIIDHLLQKSKRQDEPAEVSGEQSIFRHRRQGKRDDDFVSLRNDPKPYTLNGSDYTGKTTNETSRTGPRISSDSQGAEEQAEGPNEVALASSRSKSAVGAFDFDPIADLVIDDASMNSQNKRDPATKAKKESRRARSQDTHDDMEQSSSRRRQRRDVTESEASLPAMKSKGRRRNHEDEEAELYEERPRRRRLEENDDIIADPEDVDYARRERKKKRKQEKALKEAAEAKEATGTGPSIGLPPFIAVGQLATTLRIRLDNFVEKLEDLGFEDVANDHVLNFENASLIAMEYGFEAKIDQSETEDLKAQPMVEDRSSLPPRPPIVTIMGHVDHGKTTLLDYLRKSSVVATEHGGITQHIGAFSVPMAQGKLVTFLDTPGHAAFLSMRQRGANVTDIVVLVVAADDSVKPQTIEAIKHAKAAKVPIIVAINKVDKEESDIQRVKQDLIAYDIEVEDFGGDVQAIPVSGKTGQGMDELEEALVAQAETIDMRAEVDGPVEGWIIEASTKQAGRVATILVRRGTLRVGNIIVAGTTWARVRTLKNEAGTRLEEAGPGMPVEVDGWRELPDAGDEVLQAPSEQKATSVVDYRRDNVTREQDAKDMEVINEARRIEAERHRREKAEKEDLAKTDQITLANTPLGELAPGQRWGQDSTGKVELFFLIKADVSGSSEAIESFIGTIPIANHPVELNLLRVAVGPITESDVDLIASVPAGRGYIVSFNQPIPPAMVKAADKAGVKIFDENIIYKVIDDLKAAIERHLPPLVTKRVLGEAEAAQIFEINIGKRNTVKIAGCKIRNGVISKGKKVRVYRGGMTDDTIVYDGTIDSLKSHKKDVSEMRKGTECGMGFKDWTETKAGDVIQCYEENSEPRRLT